MVGAAWPTTDDRDYRTVIGMEMLKEVADLLLTDRIREELGASYGVSVGSSMSDTYPGFGYHDGQLDRRARQGRRGRCGDRGGGGDACARRRSAPT